MLSEQNGAYDLDLARPSGNWRPVIPSLLNLTPEDTVRFLREKGLRQLARFGRLSPTTSEQDDNAEPVPPAQAGDSLFFPGDEWGSSLGLL